MMSAPNKEGYVGKEASLAGGAGDSNWNHWLIHLAGSEPCLVTKVDKHATEREALLPD